MATEVRGTFPNAAAVRAYARAGRATLTLQSNLTGAHYTYRIAKPRRAAARGVVPPLFVSVLTGGDDYAYLGILATDTLKATKKTALPDDAPQVKAFSWFWRAVSGGTLPDSLTVRHCGTCGVCNRPLTHPTSLDTGIGPECTRKLVCATA